MKLEMLKDMKYKMPSGKKEKDSMMDIEAVDAELAGAEEAGLASTEGAGPLAGVPDEDLLAEIRKRGLSLEGEAEGEDMEMEMELEPADEQDEEMA